MRKYSELSDVEQLVFWQKFIVIGLVLFLVIVISIGFWADNHNIITELIYRK